MRRKAGKLTASLKVENQTAKEALESSLQELKQSFKEQGLKVEEVEVTLSNYSDEYNQNQEKAREESQKSSKKKIDLSAFEQEEQIESNMDVPSMNQTNYNGSVSYTA